ncbi:TPA: hypothetical protein ACM38E_002291 [Escherichia coli]|uniref:hypothetical protein n=1 Tax=Escherichia coli TaxID=562 RepID=UPI000DA4D249|nr:hypothetical protein [Escherichia coli]EAC1425887.1 hypothetical protein [Escherichia coli]EFC4798838.1 hypothetical protein [Escherichia coli]EFC6565873.1 hypothetical protein [Escherichia coli]EFH3200696.1 hypothetical protein [Escherichia coli]EFH3512686.1 hypothetical protein [Escherichia coli]
MSENHNMFIHDISSRYVGFISDDANDSLCDIILTLDLLSFLSGVAIDVPGADIVAGPQMKAILRILLRELERIKGDIYYSERPFSLHAARAVGISESNKQL